MTDGLADQLAERIGEFLETHKTRIANAASHVTNTFEAVCYLVFVRYYETVGYELEAMNLVDKRFRFKFSTRGYPWNYSYFAAREASTQSSEDPVFEIRHNQKAACAWFDTTEDDEPPVFAADVAVVSRTALPHHKPGHKAEEGDKDWVGTEDLITFAEVKKLVAYPMLLAQFFGIVHELKPEFVASSDRPLSNEFWLTGHPPPTLFTSKHLTPGTKKVLDSFRKRGYKVCVVQNVDIERDYVIVAQISRQADSFRPEISVISV